MMYKVKSNLKRDGKLYVKGDEVDLKKEEAMQLLDDNVIAETEEELEDEERESPQPAVNKVEREGGEAGGEIKVEEGKIEKPQPGENNDDNDDGEDDGEDNL